MSLRQVGSWAPALATPHARQVASAVVRARDVLRIYGGREIEAVRRSVEAERMPIPSLQRRLQIRRAPFSAPDQRSEEHTSELQSLMRISYAVFCLKKTPQH